MDLLVNVSLKPIKIADLRPGNRVSFPLKAGIRGWEPSASVSSSLWVPWELHLAELTATLPTISFVLLCKAFVPHLMCTVSSPALFSVLSRIHLLYLEHKAFLLNFFKPEVLLIPCSFGPDCVLTLLLGILRPFLKCRNEALPRVC